MPNRIQVILGSCSIRYRQATIEMIGVIGTQGTRNGRGRSGSDRRRKITAADTSTNAKSVPIFVRSTTSEILANAANVATKVPVMMVPTYGVRNFGWSFEKNFGSRPSRDIEKKMRGWPSWKTISTLPIAITAPSAMMNRENVSSPGGPSACCNAVIIGSGVPSDCHGAMPVMTADSAMYSTVQINRLMMMPNGMSFAGFFVSSAAVDTASNPMYAKKMIAAAALTPLNPLGEKPPVAGLFQLSGLIRNTPMARKNRMIPTLSTTIALVVLADSLMPMTRMIVTTKTTSAAGRLMMSGRPPKICGAPDHAEARNCVPASVTPPA